MEKADLRRILLSRIRKFGKKEEASKVIVRKLLERKDYREAATILAFFPLPSEPDISPLLEDERVLFPFIENGRMFFSRGHGVKSRLGVMLSSGRKEEEYERAVMLVPLVAYDPCLNRLGRGGGYYDRYIRTHREKLECVIGVAFSISCVDSVGADEGDERLDAVVTE